jgi:NADPH:quinone reductase-like Zn-dependent oxidoreductase
MKAVVNRRYGSPNVLEIRQVPKPALGPGDILIRVHATTVSRTDCGMLRAKPFLMRLVNGLIRPKLSILGMDFAGTVEAIGAETTTFRVGESVFGISPEKFGAHAEYICLPEKGAIAIMPTMANFEDAVVCEGAWYANTYLNEFGLKRGHKILIYGASGAIGTAAVQLAKFYGAEVTAVVSTRHLDLVKSLGADCVIDYTVQDFTQINPAFDFVLDAVGKTTFFRCRKILKSDGIFSATDLGPWYQNLWLNYWSMITGNKKVVFPMPKDSKVFVDFLRARMQAGEFRAVVDRKFSLDEIIDAYRFVETAQKTGIVVIRVATAKPGNV